MVRFTRSRCGCCPSKESLDCIALKRQVDAIVRLRPDATKDSAS